MSEIVGREMKLTGCSWRAHTNKLNCERCSEPLPVCECGKCYAQVVMTIDGIPEAATCARCFYEVMTGKKVSESA